MNWFVYLCLCNVKVNVHASVHVNVNAYLYANVNVYENLNVLSMYIHI